MSAPPVSSNMQATSTILSSDQTEIRIQGKDSIVPSICICGRTVIVVGRWLKIASVHDEFFVEDEIIPEPRRFIAEVQWWNVKPDLFTFAQKVNDLTPRFNYHIEWEDFAVIPITTYQNWFKKQIRRGMRVNLHRAT